MSRRWDAIAAALVGASLLIAPALGQAQSIPTDDFSAHRFYLAPGPNNYLMVDGADVGEDMTPHIGATLGYAHRPYAADDLGWYIDCEQSGWTLATCADNPQPTTETDFLSALLTLQLHGSFTFLERFQVGLNLPLFLYGSGESYERVVGGSARTFSPGGEIGGIGDPRISAKVRILDPDPSGNGVTLGAAVYLNLPIGHAMWEGHFVGDRMPQGGGHLIAGLRLDDLRIGLNVGVTVRDEATNIRSQIGTEATWGLAAAYRFGGLAEVLLEWSGATSFGRRFDSEAPMEGRLAGNLRIGDVNFQLGVGAGLLYGIGVPVFRAFGGASWSPAPDPDTDGDGVHDSSDGCPGDAEDMDGWDDEDGCPELDNDEDEIPDDDDPCPNEPEDNDGHEDEDGCPDEDNDGDGIQDGYDSCPNTPEDMDGDRDTDGCPDHDQDGDGIDEEADRCPTEPEDFDGFGDEDGCPETDFDEDGVPDERDECPEEAEDRDRFQDRDGCPEPGGSNRRR